MITEKIRNTVMFSSFNDAELEHLDEMTHLIHLKNGEQLFQQGMPFKSFYFVISGIVKLGRLSPDGDEKIIELIRPDNFFAEALVFRKSSHYPVYATAMQNCEILSIDAAGYAALLRKSIDTCFNVMGAMSQRIHGLISEIDSLTLHNSKSRLASYLFQCVSINQQQTFKLELPKGVIASRLSMKPETFSRTLHSLNESGIIRLENRMVTVLDIPKLQQIAEQSIL